MVAWCPRSDKWLGNRSSTVPTCKRLSEGRTVCCSSGACTGWCHTAEKAHALSSTKMTTRDALKECTRSRTGRLSHERWRVTCRTMRMEEAPPIRVQVKNVLGASAVRSCAAGGACMTGPGGGLAGHTRSARGDATEAWRAQQEDALQEQGPGLPVRARSVRSCAAEGAGSTYAAGGCSSGSPACPAGACLERSPDSCTTRVSCAN